MRSHTLSVLDIELIRSLLQQQFYEPIDQIIDRYHSVRIPIPGSGIVIKHMVEFLDLTLSFLDFQRLLSQDAIIFLSNQLNINHHFLEQSLSSRMNVILEPIDLNGNSSFFPAFLLLSGLIESIQQANTKVVNDMLMAELESSNEQTSEQIHDWISRLPPRWYSEYSILINLKVLEHYARITNQPIPTIPFNVYKKRVIHALTRIHYQGF